MKEFFAWVTIVVLFSGCGAGPKDIERKTLTPDSFMVLSGKNLSELKAGSPFLKAHMKSGNLYVLHFWDMKEKGTIITGNGVLLSAARDTLYSGDAVVSLDSVLILETNTIKNSGAASSLTVITGVTALVAAICITNPKACFGSCPTFYVSDGDSNRLQAEGFSSSISPSLEATDVDALYHASPIMNTVEVHMKNEALETHVIRHADILAVPRPRNGKVFAGADQRFWQTGQMISPVKAVSPEGDCRPQLLTADWNERFSLADEKNLGGKETIDLEFQIEQGKKYGIVIGSRQALLPTYLLYQALAYMGTDAGYWLAEIERKHLTGKQGAIESLIGGIEILAATGDGNMKLAGSITEHGPLAIDMHMIPLGELTEQVFRAQLRMTKGAWRIDYVALAELLQPVTPVRIRPSIVLKEDSPDSSALSCLLDSTRTLVTFPGDNYTMIYKLPVMDTEYELFLESRGYYLEWIRKEWIEEQNPYYLAQMFFDPKNALERLAPEFKAIEPSMEDCFWRSRYAKP
jgi:hypothetical protein